MVKFFTVCVFMLIFPVTGFAQKTFPASEKHLAAIREDMQSQLKDADSAKFKDVILKKGENSTLYACGYVNSKNSYGAYEGFRLFFSSLALERGSKRYSAFVTTIDFKYDVAKQMCEQHGISL